MRQKLFQWAVVGAGPAGIAAVGKLIEQGILAQEILWIDPLFTVGDLGQYWSNVSSNTKVKLFHQFLQACSAFNLQQAPDFTLNHLPMEDTCSLKYIVEPLQWITTQLSHRVQCKTTLIRTMELANRRWILHDESHSYESKQVILATGAVPSALNFPTIETIPFHIAIDKSLLQTQIKLADTIAVFGSSHSAIIILKSLVELGVKTIHNFYRSPCRYAIELDDWILFDNTGLKGQTAKWARQFIDGQCPDNLIRHMSNESNLEHYLPECDQAIYAVGFTKRETIAIGYYEHKDYNPYVGIIGPGLFGLGIAYPELKLDRVGNSEYQVGLWKFMTYLNRVLPIWFKYHT